MVSKLTLQARITAARAKEKKYREEAQGYEDELRRIVGLEYVARKRLTL